MDKSSTDLLSVNSAESLPQIQISENNGFQTISARELYKGLEISKRFSEWFETNSRDFVENEDFTSVLTSTVVNNGAKRDLQDYAISIDMAKSICLMSKTEIGKKYRTYLINLEKAWNEPGAVMARALEIAHKTLEDCQKQVALMQPKAESYDALMDADGLFNLTSTAKLLDVNFNWFKQCLIEHKYLYRGNHDKLIPYADHKSIFVVKEWTKNGIAGLQTLVTPKGTEKLRILFKVWGKSESDSKRILEETAESFLEKGEAEYQRIIDKTTDNYIEKAIKNNPVPEVHPIDKLKSKAKRYSFDDIAEKTGYSRQIVINAAAIWRLIDQKNGEIKPSFNALSIDKFMYLDGRFTPKGYEWMIKHLTSDCSLKAE